MDVSRAVVAANSPAERTCLKALLEADGVEVLVSDGAPAELFRALAEPRPPDLLVLGLGGDPVDLCRRLRAQAPAVPLLLLVDRAGPELAAAGVTDVLVRGWTPDEAVLRLRSLLQRRGAAGPVPAAPESGEAAEAVLLQVAAAFDSRDPYREGHADRIARMARRLGERLALSPRECEALFKGGQIHDLGMVRLPEAVVSKTGGLTADELDLMKQHTVWGEEMCRPVAGLRDVLPILRHHHEQHGGRGYPDGLSGDEIPLLARIVSVVDTFDSLCSDRPYRRRHSLSEATRNLGMYTRRGWLDPKLTEAFLQMVEEEGWPEVPPVVVNRVPEDLVR